ncbi:MAG: glycosyltransferase family 2 protein [Desulfovibrionaceae bacterium]
MDTITGLVLTYNGERLLEKCLQSLDFCDEVLVVDSESTDATADIARRMGARVLTRAWEGPVPQFRFALERIDSDWVVSLDQDEFLSPELRAAILVRLRKEKPAESLAGYFVHRRSFYFNRFLKHSGWYPDRLLRVFRPGRMEVTASGAHYHFHPQGETATLDADIVHYPYRNFREHLEKINSYAEQGAADLRARGRRGGLVRALAHAKLRFFKLYVLKLGLLDGRAGLINALAGAYYAFQKHLRVMEKGDWGAPYDG